MGQSQSQIESDKQRPLTPTKVFGFIFFQRYYDGVYMNLKEKAGFLYEIEVTNLVNKGFQEFKVRFEKMTPEEKAGFPNAIKMWNGQEKEKYRLQLMNDEARKNAFCEAKLASGEVKQTGLMGDLHATYFDAI